ncbi:MAG: hypothetical protein ABSC36_03810 [Gaiellaceae bacterium]|jgi:hypothetical protein
MAAIDFPRARTQPPQARDRRRLNAQVARMVNELLLLVARSREFIPLRCECGVLGCPAPVVIPRARLSSIRDEPGVFVVAPGHFVDTAGELLASDLTYALISYRDIGPILTTEAELADLVYHSLPRNAGSEAFTELERAAG